MVEPSPAGVDAALERWGERWLDAPFAGPRRRLYVGFSGGLDSVVLLHAANRWYQARSIPTAASAPNTAAVSSIELIPVHINHGVAAASEQWVQHCRSFSARLGLRCLVLEAAPAAEGLSAGAGFEARARVARYARFAELLREPADSLLLAHHRDDQSETLLLRLFQGRGLLPMPAQRRVGAGTIERPLLRLERDVLAAYARSFELPTLNDPSNADTRHERNYLRHVVLPPARERWPQLDQALERVALRANEAQQLLEGLLAGRTALAVEELTGELGLPLLRSWLHALGEHRATDRALTEFLRQLKSPGDRAPELRLPGGRLLRRQDEVLWKPVGD